MAEKPVDSPLDPSTWEPIIRMDLLKTSSDAFEDAVEIFNSTAEKLREAGKLPAFPFDHDGWYNITPQMAEAGLLHSAGNRVTSLPTLKAYAVDMTAADWAPTGETVCASEGKLRNGHHRLWSGYLAQQTFPCYVVASVPPNPHLFAFYDSGKKRNGADALHIAGWNGSSRWLSDAIKELAIRYDNGKLGVQKQPKFRTPNSREILRYMQDHPELRRAAQEMLGGFPAAVEVIRSKPAAIVFAWLVLRAYSTDVLGDFCESLGTGAMLPEDSVVLAVRAKLMAVEDPENRMLTRTRLAYVAKAFMMHVKGQKMPRVRGKVQPLVLGLDEPFPRIEAPFEPAQAA